MSVNDDPPFVEKAEPLKACPPVPVKKNGVSKTLPESLNPATTLLPQRAVEVSLSVNPPSEEKARSSAGLDSCTIPPLADGPTARVIASLPRATKKGSARRMPKACHTSAR